MSDLECLKYAALITKLDVFSLGVLCGGVLVAIAKKVEKYFDLRLMNKQKELDIILGKELVKYKDQLDKLDNFINARKE